MLLLTPHEYRRAVILTPNDPWGEVPNDLFTRAVKQVGGSVVAAESCNYGIDGVRPLADRFLFPVHRKQADSGIM
jgi:hypothetical protein